MLSDLTYKVVAYSVDLSFNSDDCVDWAIEMLELGHETESLLILAGLSKPTNHFVATDYLRRAFRELGLEEKIGDDGLLSHCKYYIHKIASGENVRQNLRNIRLYCRTKTYKKVIFDFYLLQWARDDLDYNNSQSSYWPEADSNTIETITIGKAKKWIAENEKHYAQQKL